MDFEKVMKTLDLDKNDENVEKACNVAQTNYKLRNKKEEGKNMKLDKAGFTIMVVLKVNLIKQGPNRPGIVVCVQKTRGFKCLMNQLNL